MKQKRIDFSAMLTRTRLERGMAIETFAQLARISPAYLQAIEEGRCEPPRPMTIARFCRALSLSGAEADRFHWLADICREQMRQGIRLSRPAKNLIRAVERYAPALPDQYLNTLSKMIREAAER